jgi:MFS family permease
VKKILEKSEALLIVWCIIAAFGTYFCMYAFRKPFTTGLYEKYELWGMGYKSILIISQVFGYMLSKIIGIKVIAELKAKSRILLIIGLIAFAEVALLAFGFVPFPYNFGFLFLNGLPLGMVWGVIFSFLEGRKLTEFLSLGLSLNLVMTSGVLKTIYLYLQETYHISEFHLPYIIGLVFLPFFLFFVWMLAQIPPPNEEDLKLRNRRTAMTKNDKDRIIKEFGVGLFSFIGMYLLMATMRDFRDNFAVEVWREIDPKFSKVIFSQIETTIGLVVVGLIALIAFIRNNFYSYLTFSGIMLVAVATCGGSTWAFQEQLISAKLWMLSLGIGLFLPYLLIQTVVFERLIALFKAKGNVGFLVYICDSIGYLGSVSLLVYREFFLNQISFVNVLIIFSYIISGVSFILLIIQLIYFTNKHFNGRVWWKLSPKSEIA